MAKSKPPIKKKYIESPEKLWEYFMQYVQHEQANPMLKVDYVGKDGEKVYVPLQVPITFEGFECWLADQEIIEQLGDYSSNKGGAYDSYSTIITRIRSNCFVQNFKGAAVGVFNANLIAKKIGLVEKVEQTYIEQPLFPEDKK
jgi:hypothetical protein